MKHFSRKSLPGLALVFLLAAGLVFFAPAPALAGGSSEYEWDGHSYTVEWSDEWGDGTVIVTCEYCSADYTEEFSGGKDAAEQVAEDLIFTHFLFCGHCEDCFEDYHCQICVACFENGDAHECSYGCNSSICLLCHENSYICDICGHCRLEDGANGISLTGTCVNLPGIEFVCGDCLDNVWECENCGNVLGLGDGEYLTYEHSGDDWCPECGLCRECVNDTNALRDFGHCILCGVCGSEADVCDECHLCENCRYEISHCPECNYCFGEQAIEWCPSDGAHCVECDFDNDWICEQCGECMEATGRETCPDCGLCEDCCYENSEDEGCTHGYCVLSAEYDEHACPSCGRCPDDTECEYCGFCEDCQQDYHCEHEICPENDSEWEEHLCVGCGDCFELDELCDYCHLCENCREHCRHGRCPEDIGFEDHFCKSCGNCYESNEFCGICGLCKGCCADNTEAMGCSHKLCIKSGEFRSHYCFAHSQCLQYCSHNTCSHLNRSSVWSGDDSAHWHQCLDCGASASVAAHTAGNPVTITQPDPLTRTNGTARISCTVCGRSMGTVSVPYVEVPADGSPYILSQPKDYQGRVSTEHIDNIPLWTELSLLAGGEGTLRYQWYVKQGDTPFRALEEDPDRATGTKTSRLRLLVPTDACNYNYQYYCVVTNAKGSAATRTVKIDAHHVFGEWWSNGASTHSYYCLGEGCEVTQGDPKSHRFGNWTTVTAATSENTGLRERVCQDCSYRQKETIPKVPANHVHSYSIIRRNETYHWRECACGERQENEKHRYSLDWTVTLAATETREGRKETSCLVCGEKKIQTIGKLGHTHDFETLIKSSAQPYELPNGYISEQYHVRYCRTNGCFAEKKELHSYCSWRILNSPYTQDGVFHYGRAYRNCTVCGHGETQSFSGKWPILTEVYGDLTAEGFGGAQIRGPVSAAAGEKVTLTVILAEGFTVDDKFTFAENHGWSLDEVTSHDGMTLYGSWTAYQNDNLTDFKVNATTFTATFTMPNGPVALGFFPSKCSHQGASTYSDVIESSCTVAGANVLRCSHCKGVVKTVSRIEPKGHTLPEEPIAGTEVRAFCSYNTNNGETRQYTNLETRSGYSGDFRCTVCGKVVKGKKTGLTHGIYGSVQYDPDRYPQYWGKVYETRDEYDATCTRKGYTGNVYCKLCGAFVEKGEYEDASGHSWSAWTQSREATTRIRGQESRTCKWCDKTEVRTTDYSGPDYTLTADKTKVHFSFTYGEKPDPVIVTFQSVGRNPVSAVNTAGEQKIGGTVDITVDGMKIAISPYLNGGGFIWNMDSDDYEIVAAHSVKTASGITNAFTAPDIIVTAGVKKTAQKYTLTVQGGEARIEGAAGAKGVSSLQVQGGEAIELVSLKPGFVRWEVISDKSGLITEILSDNTTWTDDPVYFIMSPNDVTVKAVYQEDIQHPNGKILTVPAKTKTIQAEAFMGTPFRWVKAGSSCTELGARAFADCKNLVGIFLPGNVTFQKDTFAGSKQLVIYAPAGGTTQKLAHQYGIPFVNWQ